MCGFNRRTNRSGNGCLWWLLMPTCKGSEVQGVYSQKHPVHGQGRQHELQRGMHPSPLLSSLHRELPDHRGGRSEGHEHGRDYRCRQLVFVRHVRAPVLGERCGHLIEIEQRGMVYTALNWFGVVARSSFRQKPCKCKTSLRSSSGKRIGRHGIYASALPCCCFVGLS